ncbi:hypothetical protein ACLB2K_027482 [Fragaria x ananassa]
MALRPHTVTSAPTFHSRQFLHRPTFPPKTTLRFRNSSSSTRANSLTAEQVSFTEEENSLVEALIGIQGRGRSASPQQLNEVESAVKILEALKGVPEPTSSSLIEGRWQLMFTTRPGTASPIQRTFVGVDFFSVFQEVYLQTKDQRVSNIVKFSDAIGELKVEAEASIKDGKRILFRFDKAAFSFKFLPFKVPYPVPFRLLGDEAKGWLDTTYLSESGNLRISRGNKGTTFVLQKKAEPRQRLLSVISTGTAVKEAIEEFISLNQNVGESELQEGEWKMVWSSQEETDSWLENAANGLMGTQIVKGNEQIKFVVDAFLGLKFSISGTLVKSGSRTYDVTMDDAAIIGGGFGYPLEELGSKFELELLYSDDKIRITRGYNKILFVHVRTDAVSISGDNLPKKKSVRNEVAMANQKKENFSVKETKPSIRAKKPLHGPTTSFDLVEEMLYLYVRIEKARGVPVQSPLQVELKNGNYRGATTTVAQTPQGEFNWYQVFAFTKSRLQDTTVHVSVKADGGVVSKCSFGVSEALRRVPPDPQLAAQWCRLVDTKGNGFGGELMMAFWTGTQADEVYNVASHSDAAAAALSPDGLSSICPRVYHTPRFWYLRVHVIAAQDLEINDINNREQPAQVFVEASVLDCKLITKACSTKTVDPKWNEDLMFVVAEPFDATLAVRVFEIDKGHLGSCEIPIKSVGKRTDRSPAASLWYDLKIMPDQATFASKINMRISLDGGYHVIDEPTEFTSDFRPSAKILWKPPVGTFELGIISASGLSPTMPKTSVDTFCVAKYGPRWVRTRTVIDNRSPKWNEQYLWDVYDHCTVITIAVFENKYLLKGGGVGFHGRIGRVRIRLSDLDLNKVYTNSHPLVSLDPYGVKKRGELQLSYRFCPTSKFNVYTRYTEPLLPKLHYVLPLSVPQIRILRDEAVKLTKIKLERAQLGEEVVHYVLFDHKDSFSVRKAGANYFRCMKLLQSFSLCKQRFDQLRNWTNPCHTGVFTFYLIAALWFPSLALAYMFFMISVLGAWGYRKRPRQLPHIEHRIVTGLQCPP